MKKNNWQKKILILFTLFIFSFFLSIGTAKALSRISNPIIFKAQTTIPGVFDASKEVALKDGDTSYLAHMIKSLYEYGIGIAGILAAIMLMAGGVVWLSSAGSSEKISQAKNLMSGSIIGLVILFGSWMMLRTINPELVDFRIRDVRTINQTAMNFCESSKGPINYAQFNEDKTATDKDGKILNGSVCSKNETCYNYGKEWLCGEISMCCNLKIKQNLFQSTDYCFDIPNKPNSDEVHPSISSKCSSHKGFVGFSLNRCDTSKVPVTDPDGSNLNIYEGKCH